jgi:hypothetical protein
LQAFQSDPLPLGRAHHPDDNYFIVSNKVKMLTATISHAAARGSNDLMEKNILQTMTFMTPDEYERLQALNAWTGRSDLTRCLISTVVSWGDLGS